MSDELRAMAEFVLREQKDTYGMWRAAMALARAYLAEHPADDAEPVTEEWLRAVGFGYAWGDKFRFQETDIDVAVTTDPDGIRQLCVCHRTDYWDVCSNPTRGHVRRLLAALGIPLKEPA